jgi:hypothetical protein
MMVREVTSVDELPPPPVEDLVTLTVMLPEIKPLNPGALAVTGISVQVMLPEVISPGVVALTDTHSSAELFQVT